jgi:Flp pilus assembly secretin CpaC
MMLKRKARPLASALLAGVAALFTCGAAFAAELTVGIDQSRPVRLSSPVSTLSIGNPAIADVSVQSGNVMFVIGKSFGNTNVIGLDAKGDTVLDLIVHVTEPSSGSVTVFRGNQQTSYNCAPACARVLMPGDSPEAYSSLSSQFADKSGKGSSAAAE